MSVPLPPDAALPEGEGPIVVTDRVSVPRHELEFRASRAGGPGGQHVNTSSTRIELTWNLERTTALDDATKARVREKLASRLDGEGNVRVVSSEMRSQRQNRERAETRFAELLAKALAVSKPRKKTKPSRASQEKRLQEKKARGEKKKNRGRTEY